MQIDQKDAQGKLAVTTYGRHMVQDHGLLLTQEIFGMGERRLAVIMIDKEIAPALREMLDEIFPPAREGKRSK